MCDTPDFPFNFFVYGDNNEPLMLTGENDLHPLEDMASVLRNTEHTVDLDQ